jgi:hypothetical protein
MVRPQSRQASSLIPHIFPGSGWAKQDGGGPKAQNPRQNPGANPGIRRPAGFFDMIPQNPLMTSQSTNACDLHNAICHTKIIFNGCGNANAC